MKGRFKTLLKTIMGMASGIMGIMPWDYPWAIGNNQNEIVLRTISPILQSASNPEKCWAYSAPGEISGSWGHRASPQDEARVRDFQPKAVIFSLDFYEMPIWFLWDANLDVVVGPWHTKNHSNSSQVFQSGPDPPATYIEGQIPVVLRGVWFWPCCQETP